MLSNPTVPENETRRHTARISRAIRDVHPGKISKTSNSRVYTSESPTTERGRRFAALQRKYHEYLLSDDQDVLPILLGAVAAHRLDGEPSWLLIVGPPSGAKTDLLSLLTGVQDVLPLSDLTDKTLASGLTPDKGDDPSLLARLVNAVMVFKDFTTVLEMRREQRASVLAQLREIYDGRFDKSWGTGKDLHWKGRLSVLAGVTNVIDRHYAVMNVLGQRFMLLRPQQPDRQNAGLRALENCSQDGRHTREDLANGVQAFLADLPSERPGESERDRIEIVNLADFTTKARSSVERDGYRRELDYVPASEMPGRFARQLLSLGRGIALVQGRSSIATGDMARVRRVALDSIPTARRAILQELARADRTVARIKSAVRFSDTLVRRTLEDLKALDLIDEDDGCWIARGEWPTFFTASTPRFSPRVKDAAAG